MYLAFLSAVLLMKASFEKGIAVDILLGGVCLLETAGAGGAISKPPPAD